ncbi:MAG TPA: MarR family winged helix-turn-helix transcriptional regulator [Polyangiaceae bacterium]|jgi:DNA-binding MarR family transcriptional regulator
MRPLLADFGLTPARFDFLAAVEIDCTQSGVQRSLGLARSTVCEMVARLEELGFVWRMKFRRTLMIFVTKKAKAFFQRAREALVNSGFVPTTVDDLVTFDDVERDTFVGRNAVEEICGMIRCAFGDRARGELYLWHPDEYLDALEYGPFVFSTNECAPDT